MKMIDEKVEVVRNSTEVLIIKIVIHGPLFSTRRSITIDSSFRLLITDALSKRSDLTFDYHEFHDDMLGRLDKFTLHGMKLNSDKCYVDEDGFYNTHIITLLTPESSELDQI